MEQTDYHAKRAEQATPNKTLCVSYLPLQQVWPGNLGYKGRRNIAKEDNSLWCRWGYKIQSSREDDDVEYCYRLRLPPFSFFHNI
jgi:hypothetical protein